MLEKFINPNQLKLIKSLTYAEEGDHFTKLVEAFTHRIKNMPGPRETVEAETTDPICHLHYFGPNSDHWIIERDDLDDSQEQAFCFACLNDWKDCAELGYVSIPELLKNRIELDLYFEPKPLSRVKAEGGF